MHHAKISKGIHFIHHIHTHTTIPLACQTYGYHHMVSMLRCWRLLPPRAKQPPLRRWKRHSCHAKLNVFPTGFWKTKTCSFGKIWRKKIAFSKSVSFSVSHEFLVWITVWRFFSMKFFHFAEPFFASPLLTYCHTIVTFVTFVDLMFSNQIFYLIFPEIQFRRGVSVNGCTRSWAVSSPRKTLPLPWSVLSCWKSNLTNLTLWKLVKLVNVEQYWRQAFLVSYAVFGTAFVVLLCFWGLKRKPNRNPWSQIMLLVNTLKTLQNLNSLWQCRNANHLETNIISLKIIMILGYSANEHDESMNEHLPSIEAVTFQIHLKFQAMPKRV